MARKEWIEASQNRSDMERCTAFHVGMKFRRWIDAWEVVRKCKSWTPISFMDERVRFVSQKEYPSGVGASSRRRFVRRFLYCFYTAKLIDIRPGPPKRGVEIEFKARRQKLIPPEVRP